MKDLDHQHDAIIVAYEETGKWETYSSFKVIEQAQKNQKNEKRREMRRARIVAAVRSETPPDPTAEVAVNRADTRRVVGKLPVTESSCVFLSSNGFSAEEIGTMLGMTASGARSAKARARSRVRPPRSGPPQ